MRFPFVALQRQRSALTDVTSRVTLTSDERSKEKTPRLHTDQREASGDDSRAGTQGRGAEAGDEVRVVAAGRGRLVLELDTNVVERHAGTLRGVYGRGELDSLRDEWR